MFEVREYHGKEEIQVLIRGLEKRRCMGKPLRILPKIFGMTLIGYFIISIFASLILNFLRIKVTSWSIPICIGFLAFVFAVYDQWGDRRRLVALLSWREYKDKDTEFYYRFVENEFTVHSPVADSRYDYSVVQDIVEGTGHYLLITGVNMAHILRKEDFIVGNFADFGPWLSQKLGKEIIKM